MASLLFRRKEILYHIAKFAGVVNGITERGEKRGNVKSKRAERLKESKGKKKE
jgi:hypothetical protein